MSRAKRKSRATWLNIDVPDCGFDFEQAGDSEHQSDCEHYGCLKGGDGSYEPGNMDFECNHPRALQIQPNDFSSMLWDCVAWDKVREQYAKWVVEGYSRLAGEDALDCDLDLRFVSEDHGEIKLSMAKRLLAKVKRQGMKWFGKHVEDQRDWGYNETADELIHLPLTEWNGRQLLWLLETTLQCQKLVPIWGLSRFEIEGRKATGQPWREYKGRERSEQTLFSDVRMFVYEDDWSAYGDNVDWDKFNKKRQAKRDELLEEWKADHPEGRMFLQEPRCPLTQELPGLRLAA